MAYSPASAAVIPSVENNDSIRPSTSTLTSHSPFSFVSTSTAIRSLMLNLRQLESLRTRISPGDIRFESLCHGLASSLQEISLRLVKLCEGDTDRQTREELLECRKTLLDTASAIVLQSRVPNEAFIYLEQLPAICMRALAISEKQTGKTVEIAAASSLRALDTLEKSANFPNLFRNIKLFGSKLHTFLELSAFHCHDLRSDATKSEVIAKAETVRKLLPVVIQSLRESIQRPLNSHSRSNRAYFFKVVAGAVEGIVDVFVQSGAAKEREQDPVGQFVRTLDLVLEFCASDGQDDLDVVCDKVEWMVKFSLAVAKVSEDRSGAEIVANCQSVIKEAQRLRKEVAKAASSSGNSLKRGGTHNSGGLCAFYHREITVAKDILKDAVEELEQSLNNSLLRLIIELFCRAHSPLDELIHHVLNSPVSPPERRPEDVDDGVAEFDEWADLLFHVSHFATFCTNDRRRSRAIHSSLGLMQQLETELVPACLKLYFNPDDLGAKAHLRSVRSLWVQELECLESSILGIVDSTAFCYVIHEEAKSVGSAIKRQQYSQDRQWLHRQGSKLVRMCQRAVDFAWKDVTRSEPGLPDDHPIVKVERGTWEVQEALRLVLATIEDLNMHKTMIRRVQVLVTCLGSMASFLVARSETALSASKVRVLTSVTRITIGHDTKMTVEGQETPARGASASVSRSKAMSFRSVQRKESILKKRRIEEEEEMGEEQKQFQENLVKLTDEANRSHFPYHTRKMAAEEAPLHTARSPHDNRRVANNAATTGFDFTEIFDELSALSKEITDALDSRGEAGTDDQEAGLMLEEGVVPLPRDEDAKPGAKDVSLRKMAFKNAAAAGAGGVSKDLSLLLKGTDDQYASNSSNGNTDNASGNNSSSRASPASNDDGLSVGAPNGDFVSMSVVHSPERLRDIKSLDAKLAAIKFDLEGTEAT